MNDIPIRKLQIIRIVHTAIWCLFVSVIFYIVYSGLMDRVNTLTWICIAAILLEGLVLLSFKMLCPLTVLARKYSNSEKENFDIYLPLWLAHYNKLIFTVIFMIGLALVLLRVTLSG